MAARHGDTLCFAEGPVIASYAAVGGKKEGEGPLAAGFDELTADNLMGQTSWEAAEAQLLLRAAKLCLKKAHATEKQVGLALSGDLQASARRPIMPCGSWAFPLRGCSARAAPWPRRWGWGPACAVQALPTGCWP